MQAWSPDSWQTKTTTQQATYPDAKALQQATTNLAQLPPLVTSFEIETLKQQLGQAALGNGFLLQGGDCAESFADCRANVITDKLKILLQMSLILLHGLHKPIIRVGRIAGQYSKPRSADTETQNNLTLPSYRGDLVNCPEFTETARAPNPQLMLQGYYYSATTLNYVRALVESGFADLQHPEYWDLDFVQHSPLAAEYHALTDSIAETLDFIKVVNGVKASSLQRVDFFVSHEALHLPYEQALTRQGNNHAWYNLATHFPWLGMRTADLDGGHLEYFRGINNPVAVKIGPSTTADSISKLVDTLNPDNEAGRLTLITRFGANNIAKQLPPLIKAVKKTGKTVLWTCDPMHGNTQKTSNNLKTRSFDDILSELTQAFQIHRDSDSFLGGVHFELTGENVTECIGGARGLTEKDLQNAYKSLVDPRLNYEQALEMTMLIANKA